MPQDHRPRDKSLDGNDTRPRFAQAGSAAAPKRWDGVRVQAVGRMPRKREWIDGAFEAWAVGLVVRGRGHYRVGDAPPQPVGPGSAFTVWPGATFHYGPERDAGGEWAEWFFILNGASMPGRAAGGWFPADGRVRQLEDWRPAVGWWGELLALVGRSGPGDADRAMAVVERLLVEVASPGTTGGDGAAAGSIAAVLAELRDRHAGPVDWPALADRHAMSYSLLRQQVRRATGLPPAKHLARLRCDAACELLARTDLPVAEVGRRVGIGDPFTFSRAFRRSVGTTAAAYRRQVAPWVGDGG